VDCEVSLGRCVLDGESWTVSLNGGGHQEDERGNESESASRGRKCDDDKTG